jgi:hypothetical protein
MEVASMDEAQHIRQQNEIDRLTAELVGRFDVAEDLVNAAVRAEFTRRESRPVQDFVPIFALRSLRGTLRAAS